MSNRAILILTCLLVCAALGSAARKENAAERRSSGLDNVPASAAARANPYEGNADALKAGRKLFLRYCAECHGKDLNGQRNAPTLLSQRIEQAPPGNLFWYITNGNLRTGMPPWARLPDQQRWQIVTYLKSLKK
jgi:mono/diheme cytochrome c family protein